MRFLLPFAALGRQGSRAVAAIVFIGIAVPALGRVLKPFLTEAVFVLLCIAFLRIDTAALGRYLRRPGAVLGATAWSTLAVPALFGWCGTAFGFGALAPDLFLALMLQAIVSPVMAAPAFAALMGLDAALVLVTLITSTALVPFTAPFFAHLFLDQAIPLAPAALGLKLGAILLGSSMVGLTVRRLVGFEAIERHRDSIDGFNIVILFVFVAAMMEGVAGTLLARPVLVVSLIALAFVVFFMLLGLTALLFAWTGRQQALALGLVASQRNLGLMLAATSGAVPELVWLYFALGQFPIYLSPYLLQPLVKE